LSEGQRIKKWLYRILDELLVALIIAAVFYILQRTTIIVLPLPFLISAVVIVSVGLLAILVVAKRKRKITSVFRPNGLEGETKWDRLSLSQYLEPDPLLIDNLHRMKIIEQTYKIEGNGGEFLMRYKGINSADQISRFFRDSVTGDSPVDTSSMNIKVSDKINNLALSWKLIKDFPYEKIIEVYFFQPLKKGGEFDIEWSCVWSGGFTRRDEYVFYPVHYYKQGVEKLVARLELKKAPSYVELLEVKGSKTRVHPSTPQIEKNAEKTLVVFAIDNPKHIYMIRFGRQDL
jgi:hypothetical protein